MFPVIGFDDGPSAVRPIVAAPFKVVQIACGMDLSDDGITVACVMW
jgi:hypothetical protein